MSPRPMSGCQLGEKLPAVGSSRRGRSTSRKPNDLAFDPERKLQRRGLVVGALIALVLLAGIFLVTAGIAAAAPDAPGANTTVVSRVSTR